MKRQTILPIFLALLLLAGCSAPAPAAASPSGSTGYRQISMDEAIEMMAEESGYVILDVRREDEFAQAHIPGAVNIPNESIGTEDIPGLPDKDQLIMVYCRSGNRSKQASAKLAALGYSNVVEFGGIIDWPGETVSGS